MPHYYQELDYVETAAQEAVIYFFPETKAMNYSIFLHVEISQHLTLTSTFVQFFPVNIRHSKVLRSMRHIRSTVLLNSERGWVLTTSYKPMSCNITPNIFSYVSNEKHESVSMTYFRKYWKR